MEIYQFEQFRMIAECGTMREAAEKLYLTQPTLSYNLKKLENELGCPLFTRVHNQLRLSPYGEVLLPHVKTIGENIQVMLDELEALKRREEATLHIGCFSLVASNFIMPQIAAAMPESTFEVVNCSTDSLIGGLDAGRFDVLIATDICRKKAFKWHKLYSEQACVSAPRDSRIANRESVTGDELATEQFNIEIGLPGYSDWFTYVLSEAGVPDDAIDHVEFKEHLQTKDVRPECNLISTFIMDYVHASDARAIAPIEEDFARRNVGLVWKAGASEKVEGFVTYMRKAADMMFGGNTFIPFFLYPETVGNLHIENE